jgi:hypothetical protein
MKAKNVKQKAQPKAPKKEKPAGRKVQAVARSTAGTVQAVQTSGILPQDLQDLGPEGVDLDMDPNQTPEAEAAADQAEDMADPHQGEDHASVVDGLDQITQEVCRHYGHPFLAFSERYTREGFPLDRRGQPVRVTRMYHVVNLCLDIIPADMSKDELVARKATIEAQGFAYTYWRDNEHKQDAATLWSRVKPAPAGKAVKVPQAMTPALHGDVRVLA